MHFTKAIMVRGRAERTLFAFNHKLLTIFVRNDYEYEYEAVSPLFALVPNWNGTRFRYFSYSSACSGSRERDRSYRRRFPSRGKRLPLRHGAFPCAARNRARTWATNASIRTDWNVLNLAPFPRERKRDKPSTPRSSSRSISPADHD